MKNLNDLLKLHNTIKNENNLVHCIMNPIAINSAANIVLATGSSPIMAEHPKEVAGVTSKSKALLLNLGNITDARMKSMSVSAEFAKEKEIPVTLDLVGITISELRMELTKKLIEKNLISIIKGNMSELKALGNLDFKSTGIDASDKDKTNSSNLEENIEIVKDLAKKHDCVVVATGKFDIVSDGKRSAVIKNGVEMLSKITGTGCMLGALIACYSCEKDLFNASILACMTLGISGELSNTEKGNMTFYNELMDNVYLIDEEKIKKYGKVEYYEN